MKHIFKDFKFYDYLILILILGAIITQTFFEMEFIDQGTTMLRLLQSQLDPTSDIVVEKADIWAVGLRMLGMALIIVVAIIINSSLAATMSGKIARNLRRRVFNKVNEFSATEINKFSTPSLITRSTNDVGQVQRTFMMCLRMMFMAPFMAFFAIRKISLSNMTLTWVAVGYLGVMIAVLVTIIFFVLPKFNIYQKKIDRLNLVTRENLTGIRVVRAYNAEKFQEKKFDDANNTLSVCVFGKEKVVYDVAELIKQFASDGFGHGGGDTVLINTLCDMIETGASAETTLEASVESHLMALAAEESRKTGKIVKIHE